MKFRLELGPEWVKRVTAGNQLIQDFQKVFGTDLFRINERFAVIVGGGKVLSATLSR